MSNNIALKNPITLHCIFPEPARVLMEVEYHFWTPAVLARSCPDLTAREAEQDGGLGETGACECRMESVSVCCCALPSSGAGHRGIPGTWGLWIAAPVTSRCQSPAAAWQTGVWDCKESQWMIPAGPRPTAGRVKSAASTVGVWQPSRVCVILSRVGALLRPGDS